MDPILSPKFVLDHQILFELFDKVDKVVWNTCLSRNHNESRTKAYSRHKNCASEIQVAQQYLKLVQGQFHLSL